MRLGDKQIVKDVSYNRKKLDVNLTCTQKQKEMKKSNGE